LVHIPVLDEIGKQFVLAKGSKLERATEAKAGKTSAGVAEIGAARAAKKCRSALTHRAINHSG